MKLFKEIEIGGLSKAQLIGQLQSKGVQFNKYADVLFEHSSFLQMSEKKKIKLVKLNLIDLDLHTPSMIQEIVVRAQKKGLELCPLNLGAYLRLEFLDQPEGPYLTIASPKLVNDDSYPKGFYLRTLANTLWLRGYCASDDWEFPLDMEFIFTRAEDE